MRTWQGRYTAILALLMLCAAPTLAVATTVSAAQDTGSLDVHEQAVTPQFPNSLTMSLDATVDEPVNLASVRFSVGTYPTLFESTTRFPATESIDIELELPLQLLGIPPGVEIEYHWRLRGVSGQIYESGAQTTNWIDDRFDWVTYQTEDVTVFAYGNDADLYQETAEVAQQTTDTYQVLLQAPDRPEPIRVWLYNSQDDLHGALNPNSRDWIGGVSYSTFSLIAAVVPEGSEDAMLRVVPHEVIHQILADATENPFGIPAAWFDEGLAGWGQPVGTENFDEIVQIALEENRLPTVRSMMGEWGSDGAMARASYAASYSLVSFVVDSMGEEAILRLSEAYRDGLSHDEVLVTALGLTAEELDAEWRAWLQA